MASVSQPEGRDTPAVESVPDGFEAVKIRNGPEFLCETCGIPVE
jgi:hypothetical protein